MASWGLDRWPPGTDPHPYCTEEEEASFPDWHGKWVQALGVDHGLSTHRGLGTLLLLSVASATAAPRVSQMVGQVTVVTGAGRAGMDRWLERRETKLWRTGSFLGPHLARDGRGGWPQLTWAALFLSLGLWPRASARGYEPAPAEAGVPAGGWAVSACFTHMGVGGRAGPALTEPRLSLCRLSSARRVHDVQWRDA